MTVPIRILPLVLAGSVSFAFGQDIAPEKQNSDPSLTTIDEQVSQHLDTLAENEQVKRMDFMLIVIDDITRLCELDKDQKEQLVVTAKQATTDNMKQWREQAERYLRARIKGADPDTAKEILSKTGSVAFQDKEADPETVTKSIWKNSLDKVLSESQIKTYENVVAERNLARIDAFSKMAMTSLDNYLRLTPEQKSNLSPIIKQSAIDHLDEVRRYWGDYLEKNMLMSLVNAADKKTLTGILSANQYERLQSATSNLDHFWANQRKIKEAKNQNNPPGKGGDPEFQPPPAGINLFNSGINVDF